jgi:hypothetical protein
METPDFAAFVAGSVHVPRPLKVKVTSIRRKHREVLATPVDISEEDRKMSQAIVAFFEMYPIRITNLFTGHVVSKDELTMGRRLKPLQGDRRPEITVCERYGRAFQTLLRRWAECDYSADVMFYEPDSTEQLAVTAWKFSGMYPGTTGTDEVVRDLTSVGKPFEYTVPIEFAHCDHSDHVTEQASKIVAEINAMNANPNLATATQETKKD